MKDILERVKKDLPGVDLSSLIDTEETEIAEVDPTAALDAIRPMLDGMSSDAVLSLVKSILEYKSV